MFWKKKNPLLKLRTDLLEGKVHLKHFKGKNEIAAIITDIGMKSGVVSLVCIADGTCSL